MKMLSDGYKESFLGRSVVCDQGGRQSVVITGLSMVLSNEAEVDESAGVARGSVMYGAMMMTGMRIELGEVAIKARSDNVDVERLWVGPREYPMWAVRGDLAEWKLWLMDVRCGGEVWLNFVNTNKGVYEMWPAVEAETGNPIREMRIWLTDNHYYDYRYCAEKGETTLVERWKMAMGNRRPIRTTTITRSGEIMTIEEC